MSGISVGSALAGCVGTVLPDDDPEDDAASTTTVTATPSSGAGTTTEPPSISGGERFDSITLDPIQVRKAVSYIAGPSAGVLTELDSQFVVAEVAADRELSRLDFRLETDEDSYRPNGNAIAGGWQSSVAGLGSGPVGEGNSMGQTYLAFQIPSPLSTETARIHYAANGDEVAWELSVDQIATLAAPSPDFELETLDAPAEVEAGEPVPVTLTVRNTAETRGRFLAAVGWPTAEFVDDIEVDFVDRVVPAGERATIEMELNSERATIGTETVRLTVDGDVEEERPVRVIDPPETTTGSASGTGEPTTSGDT